MNESQIAKIRNFISDTITQETVKKVLLNSFMKKKETDVNYLAAQMLAVQLLEEGWRELENQRAPEKQKPEIKQVGL